MNSESERQSFASLELIAYYVEKQLDSQWQHWEEVDGRLRLLLGLIGAIFVAALAFANQANDLSDLASGLLIAAVVVLLVSGIIASASWLPRRFERPPKPAGLRERYLASPQDETRLAVLDTMLEAYEDNQRRIDEKLAGFRNAALALGVPITLIAIAAIIELGR